MKDFARKITAALLAAVMLISMLPIAVSEEQTAAVERIDLNIDAVTIGIGQNIKTIKPVAYPEGSATKFTWESEDPSIAKVNAKGKIKGMKKGTTTITVSAGSGVEAEVDVTVVKKGKGVTKIALNKKTASIARGKSITLKATLTPKKPKNKTIIWESSNEAVATVDSKGKVTGVSAGTATISAISSSGKTAKCKVTVTGLKVKKIKLSGKKEMLRNETQQLTAKITPADADNQELKWTSSNKKIATVDQNGVITALKKGSSIITATAKDGSKVNGTFKITVKKGIFTPTPTPTPTAIPTATPTVKPTATPSVKPTATPTTQPTATPTAQPTATPIAQPTATPTAQPTVTPTAQPTATPTAQPTATPTAQPTVTPTMQPTVTPTMQPTATATILPTATPVTTPIPTTGTTVEPTQNPTTTPENFEYTVENGEVTITGYIGTDTEIAIPSVIDNCPVTTIGENSFYNCGGLTSVSIPNSVTSIYSYAFEACSNLVSVTIPENVTYIDEEAFAFCSNDLVIYGSAGSYAEEYANENGIAFSTGDPNAEPTPAPISITDDNGITYNLIDGAAVVVGYDDRSAGLVIPNEIDGYAVTSIGDKAFEMCSHLTSVTIPDSVTSIGSCAFGLCSNLASVAIPDSVTSIGTEAFSFCSSDLTIYSSAGSYAETFASENGITYSNDEQPEAPISFTDENGVFYLITDGVAIVDDYNDSLAELAIPDEINGYAVTSIGDYAFCECYNLANIVIPESVTYIGEWAFYDTGLTSIVIPEGVTSIGKFTFYDCDSLTSVCIPDSVTSIGDEAFRFCSSLTSITIPDSVTSIGDDAFGGCSSLTSISIPDSITSIGDEAFRACSSLTSITIPNSVTSIGYGTFGGCSSLTSASIPDSVTFIGNEAFHSCSSLSSVTIPDSVTSIGEDAFRNCSFNLIIYGSADSYAETYASENSITFVAVELPEPTVEPTPVVTAEPTSEPTPAPTTITDDNGITYYLAEGSATATDYDNSSAELVIPNEVNGYAVTSIGDCTFNECGRLTSIVIPDSVTSIGVSAFYFCTNLTNIDIPDSVTSIGERAFYYCKSLTSIVIPDSVTSIGDDTFSYCESLTSIVIPDCVISIGDDAFSHCESLTSIVMPDGIPSIGDNAFSYCESLTSINIPDSVTSIGDNAFSHCESLTSIVIPDSVTSIGNHAFYYCYRLTSINIPDSVTSIGVSTFNRCASLTSIDIPDSVISIGEGAFYDCNSLSSIVISDRVTSIGDKAFSYCKSLTSIVIPDSVTSIGENAFYGCTDLTIIALANSYAYEWAVEMGFTVELYTSPIEDFEYAIENGEVTITDYLGTDTKIIIPSIIEDCLVTTIGASAFYNCYNLISVTIPDSVTSIGNSAFYCCYKITSVTIPTSVTSIGSSAFRNCNHLTSIAIPNSVTSIGDGAFSYCESLTSVAIPDSITSIGRFAFGYCESLTSVTISDSVISIGDAVFQGCESLTSITIPGSVTSIGEYAFENCVNLSSVTILDGVTGIGRYAFHKCSSLTTFTIPSTVTYIGAYAFHKCSSLISAIIPDSVTSIGAYAFNGCTSLDGITIPDSISIIDWCLFGGCTSLTSITIPGGVTSIQGWAFRNCSNLANITLPDSVTHIGEYAFGDCVKLTSITLPDGITGIDQCAFDGCRSLTNVNIPDSVTSIETFAFWGCALTSVTIPSSVTYIGSNAFDNNITIYGEAGSAAETYAGRVGIPFVAIEIDNDGYADPFKGNYVWTIDSAAAELVYMVNSPTDWEVSYIPDWVTLSATSGISGNSIIVSAEANTGMDRTDYVRFESDSQYSDLIIKQSGDAGESLADPVITYPAEDNAVVELVDIHVLWNKVEGADRYIFSLRDLTTDSLLAYHMDASDDTTATEITLPVTYFTAGHSYRVAIGAVAEGKEFYEATTSWAERVFQVECTIEENTASLNGKVVSSAGNPIEGALVSVYTSAGDYENVRVTTAITEADGSWNCEGLYRGTTYYCNAEKHNYSFLNGNVTVTASGEKNNVDTIFASNSLNNEVLIFNTYPTQWECSEEDESVEAYITTNGSWTATVDVEWISLSTTSGNGSGAIGIEVAANTEAEARIGTITVTSGEETAEISITQEAATVMMLLSTDTVIKENTVIAAGDHITYSGDLIVKDVMRFYGGSITVEGNMIVKAKGRIDMSDGGTITVKGDFKFDSNMSHATYLTDGTINVAGDVEIKRNFYASGSNEFHVTGSNVHKINMWNKWIAQDQYFNIFAVDGYGIEKLNIVEPFSCIADGGFALGDWSVLLQNSNASVFSLVQTYTNFNTNKAPEHVNKYVQIGLARAIAEYADEGRKDSITGIRYIKAQKKGVVYSYLKDDHTVERYGIDINIFNVEISKEGKAGFGTVTYHDYATGKSYDFLITSSRDEIYNAFLAFHQVVKDFAVTGLQDGFEGTCKDVAKSLILEQLPPLLVDAYTVTKEMCSNKSTLDKCFEMVDKF